jgi:uncharacterized protein YgiB involved in biofilm formation
MTQVIEQISSLDLETELQQILMQARQACAVNGDESNACAAAWDAVEELQAAIADRKFARPKTSLEVYCDTHPDAAECRIYDV